MNLTPSPSGRNRAGQFASGNKYGRGNPHGKRVALLRSAVLDSISPGTAKKLVKSLVTQAMAGDLGAAKFILPYLIGLPPTCKELENEIVSETIELKEMTDAQLEAICQGVYEPGQEYVLKAAETVEQI